MLGAEKMTHGTNSQAGVNRHGPTEDNGVTPVYVSSICTSLKLAGDGGKLVSTWRQIAG